MTPTRRMVDDLLQRPLDMWKGLGRTAEAQGRTDVVSTLAAKLAALAGETDLESNAMAGQEGGYRGADGDDDAAGLMTQGQGLADGEIAVAVVVEVVQVRAAEAG